MSAGRAQLDVEAHGSAARLDGEMIDTPRILAARMPWVASGREVVYPEESGEDGGRVRS